MDANQKRKIMLVVVLAVAVIAILLAILWFWRDKCISGFDDPACQRAALESPSTRPTQTATAPPVMPTIPSLPTKMPSPTVKITAPEYVEGQVMVIFKPDATEADKEAILRRIGGQSREDIFDDAGIELLKLKPLVRTMDAIAALSKERLVKVAEPDYYQYQDSKPGMAVRFPNDPRFGDQWALHNTRQIMHGKLGAAGIDIGAAEAWAVQTGTPNVVVAVADSGVDYTHPDLLPNLWVNPGEIPGNRIDDERNGYVDDIHGIDAINKTGDVSDVNGHGTLVTGIIAAKGNNAIGMAGISWSAQVVMCKHLVTGRIVSSATVRCYNYVHDLKKKFGVNVALINASFRSPAYSGIQYNAIRALGYLDILLIASAGNDGVNNDVLRHYPSSYSGLLSNVISVAAINNRGELWTYSNYGLTSVDIAAPGVNILSAGLVGTYNFYLGTSLAAPMVSGILAMEKAHNPSLTGQQLKNLLFASGVSLPSLAGKVRTGKMAAFSFNGGVTPSPAPPPPAPPPPAPPPPAPPPPAPPPPAPPPPPEPPPVVPTLPPDLGTAHSTIFDKGGQIGARFGSSIANVGSSTPGKRDYIAIGEPYARGSGKLRWQPRVGRLVVYSTITNQVVYALHGKRGNQCFASAIRAMPDTNQDGINDILVSSNCVQAATVISGKPLPPSVANSVELISGEDGSVLLTLSGAKGEAFGVNAIGISDIDEDGAADIAVSSLRGKSGGGSVAAFSGRTGQKIWEVHGSARNNALGASLETLNGSLVVGEPGFDNAKTWVDAKGKLRTRRLKDTGRVVVLSQHDGSEQHSTAGDAANGWLGFTTVTMGDLNSDGKKEFASGAPNAIGSRVRVVKGKGKSLVNKRVWIPRAGRVVLFNGADASIMGQAVGKVGTGTFGRSLLHLRDEPKDASYLVVGAPGGKGGVYVYAVSDTGQFSLLSSKIGVRKNEQLGYALASGGVGSDGKQHIIVSAASGVGAVYVLSDTL